MAEKSDTPPEYREKVLWKKEEVEKQGGGETDCMG